MDEVGVQFLIGAGLQAYIEIFKDNEISFSQFPSLLESGRLLFEQLIPKGGHRLKFIEAIEQLKSSSASSESGSSSIRSIPISCSSSSSGERALLINVNTQANGDNCVEDVREFRPDDIVVVEQPTDVQFVLPATLPAVQLDCDVIKCILRQQLDGLMVLESFKTKKQFDQPTRIKLAKVVLHAELGLEPEKDISAQRLKYLAACIEKEFGEDPVWYNPSKTNNGVTSLPSGKLYDQYTVITKELRKYGLRESRRGIKRTLQDSVANEPVNILVNLQPSPLSDEELHMRLEYLKTEVSDWETITQYWKDTANRRQNELRSSDASNDTLTNEYISKYPALKQELGYKLLELDFSVLFPEAYGRIYTHWDRFVDKVKEQLAIENIKVPAPCSDAELLHLYARLFSVVPVKVPKGKAWKPSRKDVLDGFLCYSKSDDLVKFWDDIENRNRAKGLTVQPFPMLIGDSISNIRTHYFVIDKAPLSLNSTKEVFAAAFYAYHALYTCYPVQSARLWVVLERTLFGFESLGDPQSEAIAKIPEVKRIIAALKV